MKIKNILCIGALITLPLSMSAGEDNKKTVDKIFHDNLSQVEQVKTEHLCQHHYFVENEELHKLAENNASKVIKSEHNMRSQNYFTTEFYGIYTKFYHNSHVVEIVFTYNEPCSELDALDASDEKVMYRDIMQDDNKIKIDFSKALRYDKDLLIHNKHVKEVLSK